jgi:hypothetical protein
MNVLLLITGTVLCPHGLDRHSGWRCYSLLQEDTQLGL